MSWKFRSYARLNDTIYRQQSSLLPHSAGMIFCDIAEYHSKTYSLESLLNISLKQACQQKWSFHDHVAFVQPLFARFYEAVK